MNRVQSSEFRVQSFKDLLIWQRSRTLVKSIYLLTEQLPAKEQYSLTQQMRRSAISIPSNIAEGSVKRSPREFVRFLNIAYGSLAEVETQLILAIDLSYLSETTAQPCFQELSEIGRMINGLITKLDAKSSPKLLNSEL